MNFNREAKYSVEEMKKFASEACTEKELADIFAYIWNEAWDIGGEVDEYDEGTPEYVKVKKLSDAWFALMLEEEKKVMDILSSEGYKIPKTKRMFVSSILMERNGYECCGGWYFPAEECRDENTEREE